MQLLLEFRDLFAKKDAPLSTIAGTQMRINIPSDTRPRRQRQRRFNPTQRTIVIDYVHKLESQGIIERVPPGAEQG